MAKAFASMENLGITCGSNSSWYTHGPEAKGGSAALGTTAFSMTPLPLTSIWSRTYRTGMDIFSKVDLDQIFNHGPVRPEYIHKRAVFIPFRLFKSLRMPFKFKTPPKLSSAQWTPFFLHLFWMRSSLPAPPSHVQGLRAVVCPPAAAPGLHICVHFRHPTCSREVQRCGRLPLRTHHRP